MRKKSSGKSKDANRAGGGGGEGELLLLQQARELWRLNHFDAALERFAKAVAGHPRHVTALLDGARAFGARFQIDRAQEWLDRVVEIQGNNAVTAHLVAQSYRMIFRPEKAMPLFEKVIEKTDRIPDAYLELAILYERRHRVEEAFALIRECLLRFPDYLEPRLIESRLLRRQAKTAEAESRLIDLTRNAKANWMLKAQAWGDLAEIYDRAGRFDDAMKAIGECKGLQIPQSGMAKKLSEHLISHFTLLADEVKREDFLRWRTELAEGEVCPTALLAGFPRSGTTLLEQVLDAHPKIVSSEELELFARDIFPKLWRAEGKASPTVAALSSLSPEALVELRRAYLDTMGQARGEAIGGRMHIDKNPAATLLIPAFRRLFPESVIMVALRDPRDVILSCYLRYLPINTNSVWFLSMQRTAERYAKDMATWLKVREKLPQPWVEVRYEDVVNDLEKEARRCLGAMSMEWDDCVMGYRQKMAGKAVQSPTYEAVTRPVYKTAIGRWRNYARYLGPILPVIERYVREFGYEASG